MKKISITIPCYRSEKTIEKVVEEIRQVLQQKSDEYTYEIICVNDCSPDNVWEVIRGLAASDAHVKAVNLGINRGKHAALMAAFSHVTGDLVVGVDDDGESPVTEIWNLIAPLESGEYDVAIAKYPSRPVSKLKEFESNVNDYITSILYNKPRGLKFSNFIARKRFVCDYVLKYGGPYPSLEGATLVITRKIAQVEMDARSRLAGVSGFTFSKGLALMLNGCTTYSMALMRIGWFLSGLLFVLSVVTFVCGIIWGCDFMYALILFLFAVSLAYTSLLGDFLGRMHLTNNGVPQFVEVETVNCDEDASEAID